MPKKLSLFPIFAILVGSLLAGPQQEGGQETRQTEEIPAEPEDFYLYFSGSVILEDGTPAPESLRVEFVCNGQVVRQEFLDTQGGFGFELGTPTPRALTDASVTAASDVRAISRGQDTLMAGGRAQGGGFSSPSLGRIDLQGCEVRLPPSPGFSSRPIALSSRSMFDDPDIGVIILHRRSKADPAVVTLTTLAAPPEARKAYDRAIAELAKENVDTTEATKHLEKAVKLFPNFALAWNQLGQSRLALDDGEGARQAFERAIAADPKYFGPYLGLVQMEIKQRTWEKAAELTSRMLEVSPQHPQARYFHGWANYSLGRLDAAKASFLTIKENGHSQAFPMTHFFLGIIHTKQKQVPAAASEFRYYLAISPEGAFAENLKGKIIRQLQAWEEQGLIEKEPAQAPTPPESP